MPMFNTLWQTWVLAQVAHRLNRLIQRDVDGQAKLKALNHSRIALIIKSPHSVNTLMTLEMTVIENTLFLSPKSHLTCQATIEGPVDQLLKIASKGADARFPAHLGDVQLSGQIEWIGRWQRLWQALNIDWAAWIAEQLPASVRPFWFASAAVSQSLGQAFYARAQHWRSHLSDITQEEWQWVPSRPEFNDIADQIQQLRMDADRFQLKLQALSAADPLTPLEPAS